MKSTNRMLSRACAVGIGLLLLARWSPAGEPLSRQIEEFIHHGPYKHGHWGMLVADLQSGDVLYELQADKLFAPASVTKIFSVAAALDALGADFRFETPVYLRGQLDDGVLAGDLILVASGDPTLGGRKGEHGEIEYTNSDHIYGDGAVLTKGDPLAGLEDLARQVHASGVRHLKGDVLIDDRLFEHAKSTGSGPSLLTPIVINDNLIDIVITPESPGEAAKVTCRPASANLQVEADVKTVKHGGETRVTVEAPEEHKLVVRGEIAAGHKPLVKTHDVASPASFARSLFIEALRRAGVAVDASPLDPNREVDLPPRDGYHKLRRVAQFTSPPFSEAARLILKVSHNLHASMLPLIVASRHGQRTLRDGLRHEREFLARSGVDVDTISFGGAAGGSSADFVTPRATVGLLRHLATRPDFAQFERGLPVLGEDGTLARTVAADSPVRGKVQAKTGTLFWNNQMNGGSILTSKALAGYMTAASGRRLVFALFVNNLHTKNGDDRERVGKALGELCQVIYGDN